MLTWLIEKVSPPCSERARFIAAAVVELETSAPEVVAQMLEQCKSAQMGVSADGTQGLSLRSGNVLWDPKTRPMGLTFATSAQTTSYDTAASVVVAGADVIIYSTQAYCRELPQAILDCIAADPTAPLARKFRLYARHSFVPGMRQVSNLLEAHAAVVELPPMEW